MDQKITKRKARQKTVFGCSICGLQFRDGRDRDRHARRKIPCAPPFSSSSAGVPPQDGKGISDDKSGSDGIVPAIARMFNIRYISPIPHTFPVGIQSHYDRGEERKILDSKLMELEMASEHLNRIKENIDERLRLNANLISDIRLGIFRRQTWLDRAINGMPLPPDDHHSSLGD